MKAHRVWRGRTLCAFLFILLPILSGAQGIELFQMSEAPDSSGWMIITREAGDTDYKGRVLPIDGIQDYIRIDSFSCFDVFSISGDTLLCISHCFNDSTYCVELPSGGCVYTLDQNEILDNGVEIRLLCDGVPVDSVSFFMDEVTHILDYYITADSVCIDWEYWNAGVYVNETLCIPRDSLGSPGGFDTHFFGDDLTGDGLDHVHNQRTRYIQIDSLGPHLWYGADAELRFYIEPGLGSNGEALLRAMNAGGDSYGLRGTNNGQSLWIGAGEMDTDDNGVGMFFQNAGFEGSFYMHFGTQVDRRIVLSSNEIKFYSSGSAPYDYDGAYRFIDKPPLSAEDTLLSMDGNGLLKLTLSSSVKEDTRLIPYASGDSLCFYLYDVIADDTLSHSCFFIEGGGAALDSCEASAPLQVIVEAFDADVLSGAEVHFNIPAIYDGWTLLEAWGYHSTAGSGDTTEITVYNETDAAYMVNDINILGGSLSGSASGGDYLLSSGDRVSVEVTGQCTTPAQGLRVVLILEGFVPCLGIRIDTAYLEGDLFCIVQGGDTLCTELPTGADTDIDSVALINDTLHIYEDDKDRFVDLSSLKEHDIEWDYGILFDTLIFDGQILPLPEYRFLIDASNDVTAAQYVNDGDLLMIFGDNNEIETWYDNSPPAVDHRVNIKLARQGATEGQVLAFSVALDRWTPADIDTLPGFIDTHIGNANLIYDGDHSYNMSGFSGTFQNVNFMAWEDGYLVLDNRGDASSPVIKFYMDDDDDHVQGIAFHKENGVQMWGFYEDPANSGFPLVVARYVGGVVEDLPFYIDTLAGDIRLTNRVTVNRGITTMGSQDFSVYDDASDSHIGVNVSTSSTYAALLSLTDAGLELSHNSPIRDIIFDINGDNRLSIIAGDRTVILGTEANDVIPMLEITNTSTANDNFIRLLGDWEGDTFSFGVDDSEQRLVIAEDNGLAAPYMSFDNDDNSILIHRAQAGTPRGPLALTSGNILIEATWAQFIDSLSINGIRDSGVVFLPDFAALSAYEGTANYVIVTDSLWGGPFRLKASGTADSALIVAGPDRLWHRMVEENRFWLTWWRHQNTDASWSDQVQRAIDTISARHEAYGDGVLYVPDIGEPYLLDTLGPDPYDNTGTGEKLYCVILRSNMSVVMDANASFKLKDDIITNGPDSIDRINIFVGDSLEHFQWRGGIIDGNAANQYGQASPGWTGCGYYSQGHGNGINLTISTGTAQEDFYNRGLRFEGITFLNHSGQPIQLIGGDSCDIVDIAYHGHGEGVQVLHSKNILIDGVFASFDTICGDGLEVVGCDIVTVRGVEITGNGGGTAMDMVATNMTIEDFNIHDYAGGGIDLQGVPYGDVWLKTHKNEVRDGVIRDVVGVGIRIERDTLGTMTINNVTIDTAQYGIFIDADPDENPLVSDRIRIIDVGIHHCSEKGIYMRAVKDVYIEGGQISQNEYGLHWEPRLYATEWTDNRVHVFGTTISDNNVRGVYIQANAGTVHPVGEWQVFAFGNGSDDQDDILNDFTDSTLFVITNLRRYANTNASVTNASGEKMIMHSVGQLAELIGGTHGQIVDVIAYPDLVSVFDYATWGGSANIDLPGTVLNLQTNESVTLRYDAHTQKWYPHHHAGMVESWLLAASGTGGTEAITDGETVNFIGTDEIEVTRTASSIYIGVDFPAFIDSLEANGLVHGIQDFVHSSNATSHTVTLDYEGVIQSGSLTLAEGSNITLTTSGSGADQIVTIASTASGGMSSWLLAASGTGGTESITDGETVTIAGAGINIATRTGSTVTITGTEVDGSITNEGILGVGAGGASSSTLLTNTSGGNAVTINAAGILAISESPSSNGGSITLTATEVDGSISNEGVLGVGAGGANTAVILSNTSGATGVTISGGEGITISESTSSNGGTVTITQTGWLLVADNGPSELIQEDVVEITGAGGITTDWDEVGGVLTIDGSGVGGGPWTSNTTDVFLNDLTDDVGIGTNDALVKLHISDSGTSEAVRIESTNTSGIASLQLYSARTAAGDLGRVTFHNSFFAQTFGTITVELLDDSPEIAEMQLNIAGDDILFVKTVDVSGTARPVVEIDGGIQWGVDNVDANSTLHRGHMIVYKDASGNFTYTLPDASTCIGHEFILVHLAGTGTLTVAAASGDEFDGITTTSFTLALYESRRVVAIGADFWATFD